MLITAQKLKDLRFRELMEVYAESNQKTGREEWPDLPAYFSQEMAEQSFYQYLKEVFFLTPGAYYLIWEAEGKYVSALRLEPYRDGLLLAGLETAPDARGKGYASLLIRQTQQMLAEKGTFKLYSHVDKKNTASLLTHQKCGFHQIADHAVYIDRSVNYRACTLLYEA